MNLNSEQWALEQDARDELAAFRDEFLIPKHDGREQAYFCGNSLGLQPRSTWAALQTELEDWRDLGVEGHFRGRNPWMPYHELVRKHLAELVGAQESEVVAMNSLTVNLHLLMVSFYRPNKERPAILIEAGAFPSDRYAVASQIAFHGFDPERDLIELGPDSEGGTVSMSSLKRVLMQQGHRIALVLWPGVQYRTGQRFDLRQIADLGHRAGAMVGFDLAHAVGNVPVDLHASQADFAAWCSYKYLNSGPGSIAGAFVHERHAQTDRPRFAGWWGHDQATRFRMGPNFQPSPGAEGWQLSNPPIFALAPLKASLEVFHRAGLPRLRAKSMRLTAYLEALVGAHLGAFIEIITPSDPEQRGCQLSLRVRAGRETGRALFDALAGQGIIGDWREPDVIRMSPTPLYNRFSDCWRFVNAARDFFVSG
ncbi:MAG: kynureninase [Ahniella sp.]|nr:kynureninase [Ahniella sp.]